MNRTLFVSAAIAVAGLALGGCASTGGGSNKTSYDYQVDQEKIVSVNKWANDRGYSVTWVNLPRKGRKEDDKKD
ncbi:MAG TPA: hypothetical protein VLF18_02560 [Tahibacter sp.]|uniref:hypothetical protein n=1 Tax=Tahibacter sp. TaxID=2056211 RepID=UPI002B5481E7|nr:hypothetical protein [Tahibacter sp.]HSX59059.1 hypothetical protein [Tahibacter sp.]